MILFSGSQLNLAFISFSTLEMYLFLFSCLFHMEVLKNGYFHNLVNQKNLSDSKINLEEEKLQFSRVKKLIGD